jgi:hypothetical protein
METQVRKFPGPDQPGDYESRKLLSTRFNAGGRGLCFRGVRAPDDGLDDRTSFEGDVCSGVEPVVLSDAAVVTGSLRPKATATGPE